MNTKELQVATANVILRALGGLRALSLMIGVRDVFVRDDGVQFRILAGTKANKAIVRYLPASDTFSVELLKVRGLVVNRVAFIDDVYVSDLRRVFEDASGLVLTVPRVVGVNA